MAGICLPKFAADAFKAKLKDGSINPDKLSSMTSKERHDFFAGVVGEDHALTANALFESKLLLKDQQRGIINWAKTLTGIKPAVQRDILAKVQRLDKVLEPEELDNFLADLVEKRLGLGVSAEEAGEIAKLSKTVEETKAGMKVDSTFATEDERLAYGLSLVKFRNYVDDLKLQAGKNTLETLKKTPIRGVLKGVGDLGGLVKSLKGSLDNSFIGRQGLKVLFTDPEIWARNAKGSFETIIKQARKKASSNDVVDAIKAEIYSRSNAINGTYKKMGLDIGNAEEAFPTSLPSRVPGLGRVFKASEAAFEGTAYRMRADLADKYLKEFERAGIDATEKEQATSLGKLINSLTGRGDLGRAEGAARAVNNLFFSPKFMKANIDFLTAHAFDPSVSKAVKIKALKQLGKTVAGIGTILAITDAIAPGTVEWDPRSSDFGKIKVGNTTFDVTGGMASYITLAARIARQSTKSATSGKITKLDDPKAYKGSTTIGTLGEFTQNKFSPLLSSTLAFRAGQERFTKKPINLNTTEGAKNFGKMLFAPLPITNAQELHDTEGAAPVWAGVMADALGISTNSYER